MELICLSLENVYHLILCYELFPFFHWTSSIRTKENLLNEITDLKHQLKKLEETNGDMTLNQKQLKREINETCDQLDNSHKECTELKRMLKDTELEKETALNSVDDLKEIIKTAEGMYTFSINRFHIVFRLTFPGLKELSVEDKILFIFLIILFCKNVLNSYQRFWGCYSYGILNSFWAMWFLLIRNYYIPKCIIFLSGDKTSLKKSLDDSNKMAGQLEESNLSQMKETDELRSNIRELEAARQESRREIQQLHNQVR